MNVRHAILCTALLCLTGTLRAQVCSGGAGGGIDATGNDCSDNRPEVISLDGERSGKTSALTAVSATLAAADWQVITDATASALAGRNEAAEHLKLGLAEYEIGHYAQAVLQFRHAAGLGDARAAELLALMFRIGEQFYGAQVPADTVEAARWAAIAFGQRQPAVTVSAAFAD